MSKMINREALVRFEELEKEWLETENAYDQYWDKKLSDEHEFWDWLEARHQQTAENFSRLTGLSGQYFSKLLDMLREAAMTGFFFGELRWQNDINVLIDSAFDPSGG